MAMQLSRRALAATLLAPGLAHAQEWPARPIRLVVPWPAGGPTDLYGRALARELAALLPHPVVVENRTGATGTLGVSHVVRGPADGHTLLMANTTAVIGSIVALGDQAPFDPLRDLAPIALLTESASILWVNPALGVRSFDALLARARDASQPALAFGTTGSGSVSEQSVEQIARHFRLDLTKVPYRGTAPQVADLVGGHVHFGTADFPTAAPHFREGRLVPLLVIGRERLPELPNVPTNAEYGLTEPDFTVWNGVFAPVGVEPALLARLEALVAQAAGQPGFRQIADGNGNRAIFQAGDAARRRLASDFAARRAFGAQSS